MKIQDKVRIKVLNYSGVKVCAEGRKKGYTFEPCRDGLPTFDFMDFEEIELINSRSPVFRTGGLRFDPADEVEIFEALGNYKWRDELYSEEDLEDMIFNPTIENQERVIKIKDMATIERLRGKLVFYTNEETEGISTKNSDLINKRFRELCANKVNSQITIREIKSEKTDSGEFESIKKQNELLQKQILQMQDMMSAFMNAQNKKSDEEAEDKTDENQKTAKRGRKPKNTSEEG